MALCKCGGKLRMADEKQAFYAHTNGSPDPKDWQPLKEHLQNVANLAKQFVEKPKALRGHLS
jgi:hypothetical protein